MPKLTRLQRHGRPLSPLNLSPKAIGRPITAEGFIGREGDSRASCRWAAITGTLDRYTVIRSRNGYGTIAFLEVSGVPVALPHIER
ncbi:hypothetical protein ODZ83_05460 [Acaricomes phytoseiuli]|uniref:hypothetical protein n=1 Tax=Acaricomes phytoseiuli TaxID=291968 RepID=UPI00222150E4|nr:hypothetical protein [Acaricomes phytoseiuli]MCW1249638.1 hypothetical protein [Acaricomes phytoseiuli]